MSGPVAFGIFGAGLLAALGVGEALRAWGGWAPESSRRVVHLLVGVQTALSPLLFDAPGWIYALAVGFGVVNLVASPRGIFPGMHGIERRSWGTATFPLALVAALFLAWSLDDTRVFALQAAFFVLALADPAASFVGTRVRRPGRYAVGDETKSLAGSAAFVVVASLAVTAVLVLGPGWGGARLGVGVVACALVAGAGEALGRRGWDNLWIVLAVLTVLVALHEGAATPASSGLGLVLAVGFATLAWRVRSLDTSGALAAGMLAWLVVAVGGAAWAVPIFGFFALASVLSRVGRRQKSGAEALAEKGNRRDAGQVLANGGVAGALLAATVFATGGGEALYLGFLGALAAAAADTWATEIGTLLGGPTRRLGLGRSVPPGTSGGMSVGGTLGTVLGAASVAATALPFGLLTPTQAVAVVVAGVAGSLADTILGATVQARFRRATGELTERREEDGVALPSAGGVAWIGNDAVNLACTLAGAAAAMSLAG